MENKCFTNTNIATTIGSKYKISSIYRRYANSSFETHAWEIIVWNNKSEIVEMDISHSVKDVMEVHERLYIKYK